MINLMDIIPCINDKYINLHGHVSLYKEVAKHIGQGLNTIGSNIGLSATIAGLSTAVAKGLTRSSMPPLQKAGVILGAGILGGITHSNISNYNRNKIMEENKDQIKSNNIIDGNDNSLNEFLKERQLRPVYLYENLHLDETRKTILKNTKNLSGVYLIFNKITGDYYIGSASTNRFYPRFSNHLLYFKGSKILKHAIRKYSLSNFAFLILELFHEIVNKENNKKLLDMEDFYLKSLLPNYNILTEAGSSFGYKHTELDRIKMRSNYSLYRRALVGNLNKNLKLSEETKAKIREKALRREKVSFSDQALLNMKKKSKPIILYNLDYTVFGEYTSIVEAAKSINCNQKTIARALKTEKNILKRRFIVKYIKERI